jgi:TorA maturation chaperone TorD
MLQSSFDTQIPLFLRFYARCFLYPYEELGYELQHMFRQLERGEIHEDGIPHLEQVLNIINHYQGEEIKLLRENYVILFTQLEGQHPQCPLLASDFMRGLGQPYSPDSFTDDLLDSGIPVDSEEDLDSIINYLEYLSLLYEENLDPAINADIQDFQRKHILSWIPHFSDVLYQVSQLSFYKEVATGLKDYLFHLNET